MAYHNYMTKLALILGADPITVSDDMQEVLDFEIQLANASLAEIDRHDTSSVYHKLTLNQLAIIVPQIQWHVYLQVRIHSTSDELEMKFSTKIFFFSSNFRLHLGEMLT